LTATRPLVKVGFRMRVLVFFIVLLLSGVPAWVQDLVPSVPGAILMDFTTGRLLFQKNPDWEDPPASLTKLMTLHLAWKALEAGRLSSATPVPIRKEVLGLVPPGSSLMFLEVGQRVTVKDLMLGLAVDSGNDAGLVLADFLAGSQEKFVAQMNAEAQALGMTRTRFQDAYGFSQANTTTVLEWSRFCRFYLQKHSQAIENLHSVRQFAFPLPENFPPGVSRSQTITQKNRNSLLESYPGADGLKTGYIAESGYNLAATALRGRQRLIAVLMGIQGKDANEGSAKRSAAASKLLDFGFNTYPLRPLPVPVIPPVKVWYSQEGRVDVLVVQEAVYPLSEAEFRKVEVSVIMAPAFLGPFSVHTILGHLEWTREGKEFYRLALVSARELHRAPWWEALSDALTLFFQGLFGSKSPIHPAILPNS